MIKIAGLMKLQENLLNKDEQNKIYGVEFAKLAVVGQAIAEIGKVTILKRIIDLAENAQMNVYGVSRKQFMESIKNMNIDEENK